MSVASEIKRIKDNIKNAYTQVGTKGGTLPIDKNSDNLANAISTIPQNGGGDKPVYPIVEGDGEYEVRFIDYDGQIIKIQYCHLGEDATAPKMPTHDLIEMMGWNNEFTNVHRDVDTSAYYKTTDGITHAFLKIDKYSGKYMRLAINIATSSTGNTVDWGDGTVDTIPTGTSSKYIAHTYADYGEYEVKLDYKTEYRLGGTSMSGSFLGNEANSTDSANPNSALIKLYCAEQCKGLTNYALYSADRLEEIALGAINNFGQNCMTTCTKVKGVSFKWLYLTAFGNNCIESCMSLKHFVLPDTAQIILNTNMLGYACNIDKLIFSEKSTNWNWQTIGQFIGLKKVLYPPTTTRTSYASLSWTGIESLELPEGVEKVQSFSYNKAMKELILPASLTSVSGQLASGNTAIRLIKFKSLEPPTVSSASAIPNQRGLVIEVPAESLEAYKAATNLTNHADRMVGV